MKHFFKLKITKILLKIFAAFVFFLVIFSAIFYGLSNFLNDSKSNISTSQRFGLNNQVATIASQPTVNDIVNQDVSSSDQIITINNSGYIMPTLNSNNIPGLIKLNSFMSELYGINFSLFNGYHVRQIVQNYNDQNQYFVLLVDDNASFTASIATAPTSNITFSITNPGHVLSVVDTGTSFNITADYQLDQPILDQSMMAYYSGIYFQAPLAPDQTIEQPTTYKLALKQGTILPQVTPDNINIKFYARANWYQTELGIIQPNSGLRQINGTWDGYAQSVATLLYLNSLSNMVFVSNKNSTGSNGSDSIYIFGGNQYINLWFYTFSVNDLTASTDAPIVEYASAYANYRTAWADPNGNADWSTFYSSDLITQKAYNWNLENYSYDFVERTKSLTKYPNASFIGYYIAGAKYVQQPKAQIQLSLTIPNYSLISEDKLVIATTNVFFNTGNKWVQSSGITTLNLQVAISINTAIDTTKYRNNQVSSYLSDMMSWTTTNDWLPRYSNSGYNFINYVIGRSNGKSSNGTSAFDVTDTVNDGYKAKYYNKLVDYLPEDFGNKNVSFIYDRGNVSVLINQIDTAKTVDPSNPVFIQKTVSLPLVLQNSPTKMDDFINIFFIGDTWFLVYKPKTSYQTTVWSFRYEADTDQVTFTKTDFEIDSNLQILSILPLNKTFINVLTKNTANNTVTQLVLKLEDNGSYSEYLPYKNLFSSNKITSLGILSYATNGHQDLDQIAIWGTVTFLEDKDPKKTWNLLNSSNSTEDNQALYNSLVKYTPGWTGQNYKVSVEKTKDDSLVINVNIEYLDGNYYSPEQLLGSDQTSKYNLLSKTFVNPNPTVIPPETNSSDPNESSWISAISIAIPLVVISIACCIGLAFGIPYASAKFFRKNKEILKKKPQLLNSLQLKNASITQIKQAKPIKPISSKKINSAKLLSSKPDATKISKKPIRKSPLKSPGANQS